MFTPIQLFLIGYGVLMLLLLAGWCRWQDRMVEYDNSIEDNVRSIRPIRIVSAGVRQYPE